MKKKLLILGLIYWQIIFAQVSLNDRAFAVQVTMTLLKENTDGLLQFIDPNLKQTVNQDIMSSAFTVLDQMKGLGNIATAKALNYFILYKDDKKNTFVVYVPLVLDNKKILTVSFEGVKHGGKIYVSSPFQLLNRKKEQDVAEGMKIFMSKCFSCHGKYGEGTVGPNLSDDYWKYAQSDEDIFNIIKEGRKGTIMIAYKSFMSDDEIRKVMLYLSVLQGQTMKKGKSPEGNKVRLLRDLYLN